VTSYAPSSSQASDTPAMPPPTIATERRVDAARAVAAGNAAVAAASRKKSRRLRNGSTSGMSHTPGAGAPVGPSAVEPLAPPLADHKPVGLAARLLHHLADKDPQQALLAASVLLDLVGVRGHDGVDDRVELADVAHCLLGEVRIGREARVARMRQRLVEGG